MKYKSAIVTQASGSVGGLTASHNRGGAYFRARTIPTNPGSPEQSDVRAFLATLATSWSTILDQSQRDAWDLYAANVPLVDTLGESRNVTGLNMYIRSNVPRLQAGLDRVDDGPPEFTLANLTNPGITSITATTGVMIVTFTNTDEWALLAGGGLMVATSRPQQPAINYFKGPYRFAGVIPGAATPPTSPQNINIAFPSIAGQKVFVIFRATNADGRLSTPFRAALASS